jgi:hypothetical protein
MIEIVGQRGFARNNHEKKEPGQELSFHGVLPPRYLKVGRYKIVPIREIVV